MAALKLLQRVKELNYLVLECLAERTLADHYQVMVSGGDGYDSRSVSSADQLFLFLLCLLYYMVDLVLDNPMHSLLVFLS